MIRSGGKSVGLSEREDQTAPVLFSTSGMKKLLKRSCTMLAKDLKRSDNAVNSDNDVVEEAEPADKAVLPGTPHNEQAALRRVSIPSSDQVLAWLTFESARMLVA